MRPRYDYTIADIRIRSSINLVEIGLRGFAPFEAATDAEADCLFDIDRNLTASDFAIQQTLSTSWIAEADADSALHKTDNGYLYAIKSRKADCQEALFYINCNNNQITSNLDAVSLIDLSILRFGLWVMFGIVLASNKGIAIHSSVIVHEDKGVLFLGESGTGKSTHTRLWREHIPGAKLLNDDSPIVRITEQGIRVYGSPWSGKTPCYHNRNYPIAGFCRLSQAPHNAIRRLSTIAAIGAVLPSCPPIFAHDSRLQDMICNTLGEILRSTPVYHLECLPNCEAAQLSRSTLYNND